MCNFAFSFCKHITFVNKCVNNKNIGYEKGEKRYVGKGNNEKKAD